MIDTYEYVPFWRWTQNGQAKSVYYAYLMNPVEKDGRVNGTWVDEFGDPKRAPNKDFETNGIPLDLVISREPYEKQGYQLVPIGWKPTPRGTTAAQPQKRRCTTCNKPMPGGKYRKRDEHESLVCDNCKPLHRPKWASYADIPIEYLDEYVAREMEAREAIQRVAAAGTLHTYTHPNGKVNSRRSKTHTYTHVVIIHDPHETWPPENGHLPGVVSWHNGRMNAEKAARGWKAWQGRGPDRSVRVDEVDKEPKTASSEGWTQISSGPPYYDTMWQKAVGDETVEVYEVANRKGKYQWGILTQNGLGRSGGGDDWYDSLEEAQDDAERAVGGGYTGSVRVAHDYGDGASIAHCPFCGSGKVAGRSDGTVECGFCHQVFSVRVQPAHPFMPQTIDGQPYMAPDLPQVPGDVMSDPVDRSAIDPNTQRQVGTAALYISDDGVALNEDQYVAHLANQINFEGGVRG